MVDPAIRLVEYLIILIEQTATLGYTIGDMITYLINFGAGSFGFTLPTLIGNIVTVSAGLIIIVLAIARTAKWFVYVAGGLIALLGVGGALTFFGVI